MAHYFGIYIIKAVICSIFSMIVIDGMKIRKTFQPPTSLQGLSFSCMDKWLNYFLSILSLLFLQIKLVFDTFFEYYKLYLNAFACVLSKAH